MKHKHKMDLFSAMPYLNMEFNEAPIPFGKIQKKEADRITLNDGYVKHWENAKQNGRANVNGGNTFGFFYKAWKNLVSVTVTSHGPMAIEEKPELLTDAELMQIGSFPLDYKYIENKPQYLIGMSVPPIMTAQIASRIKEYWLDELEA